MTTIEKTIDDLSDCFRNEENGYCFVRSSLLWRVYQLLKKRQIGYKPTNAKGNYICGCCGNPLHTAIINPMIQFCDHCGYKVDWSKEGEA